MQTQQSSWRITLVDYAQVPALASFADAINPAEADGMLRAMDHRPASSWPGRDRARLADTLAAYNQSVGNPLSTATLEAIRSNGVFIIAGQQPALLLGPMYTLLKAVSAIAQARRLTEELGTPVIPAFWIASEDHDLEEVNRCFVAGQKLVLNHPPGPRLPVGQISLKQQREQVIEFLRETIGHEPFAAYAIDLVSSVRFDDYATCFAELTAKLLGPHGLVLIDAMSLHDLAAPLLQQMAGKWPKLEAAFTRGSDALRHAGLTPPLDRINIFAIDDTGRHAVDPRTFSGKGSPSAGIRPIVQDALLPTLTTLVGPAELLYMRQIAPLYEVAGVSPSRRWPRLTATFIDQATRQRAAKIGLSTAELFRVLERLEAPAPAAQHADLAALESQAARLVEQMEQLRDPQNEKIIAKASESIRYQVGKVVERISQQRLEAAGAGRRNLQKIADVVYPVGKLQERIASPIEFLARFGPEFIDGLVSRLDPFVIAHQVVDVSSQPSVQGVQP
jgi:uncharacterized protein YllA (UPF0747 family)